MEAVERAIDKVIISSCEGNPQNDTCENEDWLIVEDPLRAHIAASEPSLDCALFGANINECMIRTKIMTAAGCTTIDNSGCELFKAAERFEADIAAFIGAT